MQQLKHQKLDFIGSFPAHVYPTMRPQQREALEVISKLRRSVTLELPTGSGKTAIGYTFLKALERTGAGPLFYVTPTKTVVEQVKRFHPDVSVAYGRSEHPCLYYPDGQYRADQIPCALLVDCVHRVSQETGETFWPGAKPCPYLLQKFQAKQAKIVVCTTAFYLFTQLFSREWERPAGLVIDEVHRLARVVRGCLSYEVTDYHLERAVELLESIGVPQAKELHEFLGVMVRIIRQKPSAKPTLLEAHEIRELIDALVGIDAEALRKGVSGAIKRSKVDPGQKREILKRLETIIFDLRRYLHSFEYSLATDKRHPLNYTYGYYERSRKQGERVQYRLFIKSYQVAPIIRKILSPFTVAYSATIGDPDILSFEAGIRAPFYTFPSTFPAANTRVFLPNDTPNLAMKERSHGEPTRVLRRVARATKRFARSGLRSLVVVVSDREREKFLRLCAEEGVKAISYGNGSPAKELALRFKAGEGDVLVGTVAHYGEGIDLPRKVAPVIFFLRPGYPKPDDPSTIFEERRFGQSRWRLWNWRVMIEALQVRGRNIRGKSDVGVTFFLSQQFRRFLFGVLPEWLRDSYQGDQSFEAFVKGTLKLVKPKVGKKMC